MKRLRSYGDDLYDDLDSVGEKGICKDWRRKDQDSDRSSSLRRFVSKAENGRKGLSSSSSYDRSIDDDRETSRSLRKRLDHDSNGFDRRKSIDRYRESSDRSVQICSPRNADCGKRIHRSESFSGYRREFPKGLRSERDRSRREESVSSWRRWSTSRDADEDPRFGVDLFRGSRLKSKERVNVRSPREVRDFAKSPQRSSKESSCQSKSVEVKKNDEVQGESRPSSSSTSSEMEEGELEPDPEPKHESELQFGGNSENQYGYQSENHIEKEENLEEGTKILSEENLELNTEDVPDEKEESGMSRTVTDEARGMSELPDCEENSIDGPVGNELEAEIGDESGEKDKGFRKDRECLTFLDHKHEHQTKEEVIEDASAKKPLPLEEIPIEEKAVDLESPRVEENKRDGVALTLLTNNPTQNGKDKGKSVAISPSSEADSAEDDDMEGPGGRGFDLFFSPVDSRTEKKTHSGVNKHKDEMLEMETLELCLGLPNVSLPLPSHDTNLATSSPSCARSVQSLPKSFRSSSDAFIASISFSNSQTLVHNPSCSLTQNSFDNYEHSVGSHPIFQGVDRVSHGNYEPKRKEVPLYQRILLNGDGSLHASQASHVKVSEGSTGATVDLNRQSSLARQLSGVRLRHHDEVRSPTHSIGSRETRSEYSMDKKRLMNERSGGSSLFRSNSQREMEQLEIGGTHFVEEIISRIVSEPIQVMARRIQEMTEQSIAQLKERTCEMIVNEDKHRFQEALLSRSDLTSEILSKSHRAQLEILVALKTGLKTFLWQANNISSSDLAEIFLNMRCRNISCRTLLPVDGCDCKVCAQKIGFCSACMCLVCSKFDTASNTCSWVGCDVCYHWCHTNCGLRESFIRIGRSVTGSQGTTEMQFHCVACDHPSELFGFVKEVFKTCAKEWKAETLSKELDYVKRIFSASNDLRGKQLHDVAVRMLAKLDNNSNLREVYNNIMVFLNESESKFSNTSTIPVKDSPHMNPGEGNNGIVRLSQEAMLLSIPTQKALPCMENAGSARPSLDWDQVSRRAADLELRTNAGKKPVMDELESIVKIKRAEATMFQLRADDARREAESLKSIAVAKKEKIEEEFMNRITKLRLVEAKEKRRQKLEELQVLERAHHEYFSMKMRMEADIKDLLLKMEATKRNLST